MRTNRLTTFFAVCATLLWAGAVAAQPPFPTPPTGGLPVCEADLSQTQGLLSTCNASLGTCQADLAACQNQPTVVFPGDGYPNPDSHGVSGHGPALSYTNNGDGTFTDNSTLLMWEEKEAGSGDAHDVGNNYTWSSSGTAADGTVFTVFLDTLNNTCDGDESISCAANSDCKGIGDELCGFAGHRDWRLPNVKELQSLVDYTQFNPAISSSVPGATQSAFYWSATTTAEFSQVAWDVYFQNGYELNDTKTSPAHVRAVRGGS